MNFAYKMRQIMQKMYIFLVKIDILNIIAELYHVNLDSSSILFTGEHVVFVFLSVFL